MKKISCLIVLVLIMMCTSCAKYEIPEGKIKDFVDQLDYNRAFNHIQTGKSVITANFYVDDKLDGTLEITTYIDKANQYYQYMNTNVSGSYFGTEQGKYPYLNRQVLTYMNENEEVVVYQKTDGETDEISYTEEDVIKSVNNFFYQKLESGYHSEGVYYGDYILANCGRYYSCFSLDEEKKELTYQVNTSAHNSLDQEIVTMHFFVVDEYGMILKLSSKSIVLETNTVIETTIECEYNIEIEKKLTL